MTPTEIAALTTAIAAFITALAQWLRLFGPRRNGHPALLRYFEQRLAATEAALADCLDHHAERHRTDPDRWRRLRSRRLERNFSDEP